MKKNGGPTLADDLWGPDWRSIGLLHIYEERTHLSEINAKGGGVGLGIAWWTSSLLRLASQPGLVWWFHTWVEVLLTL